jgi:4-hydroxysphinganine ceramide fatty acyl 2-hydroxylase
MKNKEIMFQNRLIEFFSRSNPIVISIIHIALISTFYYYGSNQFYLEFYLQIFLFMGGIFVWTLAEYLIHRFIFHWTTKNKILEVIHYALHGHHHENPTDRNHLFMPPIPVLIIVFSLFSSFYLLLGKYAFFFFSGFEFGYLIYSMIHYFVHLKPFSNGFMKKLWIHHVKHHYENSSNRYGVSSTFWDHVFRTMPRED